MTKTSIIFLALSFGFWACSLAGNGSNIYSAKFSVNPEDWTQNGTPGAPGSYLGFEYRDKNLTQDVFDSGNTMLYVLGTSGGGWYPLPHTYYSSPKNLMVTYNCQKG